MQIIVVLVLLSWTFLSLAFITSAHASKQAKFPSILNEQPTIGTTKK
jgi:hypothetical protein